MADELDVVQDHFGGPPPAPAEPEPWTGPSREQWEDVHGTLSDVRDTFLGEPDRGQQDDYLDLTDGEQMRRYVEDAVDEQFAPLENGFDWEEYEQRQDAIRESDAAVASAQAQELVGAMDKANGDAGLECAAAPTRPPRAEAIVRTQHTSS